jgi:hypothetical protein
LEFLGKGEFIEGKEFLAGEGSSKLHMALEKDLKVERYCQKFHKIQSGRWDEYILMAGLVAS